MPARVAVPLPLSVKRDAGGQRPGLGDRRRRAAGGRHRERSPRVPTVNVAELPLVMAGACWTVMVSVCWAEPYALAADRVIAYVPAVVGRAGQGGGAVAVVGEGDARRQVGPAERRRRVAARGDREAERRADRARGGAGAGEGRGLADHERERLGGVGADPVAGRDGDGGRAGRRGRARSRAVPLPLSVKDSPAGSGRSR